MPFFAPASIAMLAMVMRPVIDSSSTVVAVVLDGAVSRAVDAQLADGAQHDVFGEDHVSQRSAVDDLDRRRNLDPDFAEHEGRRDVGRAHARCERTEGAVRAGVRVAADDQLARCDQTFFGKHDVLDAAAPDVEEVLDVLLDREIFHELRELGRLRVFGRHEVIFDQRDLAGVEDARRAFHAAHHADGDGRGELVGQHEVDFRVDDLAGFDAVESGVPRENFSVSVMPMIRTL